MLEQLERYVENLRLEHRPEDSVRCAFYAVRHWLEYAGEGTGKELLLRYLDHWKNPRTRITNLNLIRMFVRWQFNERLIGEDWAKTVKMKPRNVSRHTVLTPEQIAAMMATFDDSWTGRRNRTLITLYAQTGCRRDEVRRIKAQDVDLDRREMRTRIKGGDTVYVHLTDVAVEALEAWLPHAVCDYVFTGRGRKKIIPLSRKAVYSIIKKAAKKAGIEKFSVHPHVFRHTVGQMVYDDCGRLDVVQKVLRHRNMTTTLIYAKLSDKEAAKAMDHALAHDKKKAA